MGTGKKWVCVVLLILSGLVNALPMAAAGDGKGSLLVFAGAASKPATEEAAKVFHSKTGVKVELVFGGSGYVLSQMMLAKQGDVYFPGSSDYMEKAKKKGAVLPETERIVVYLVPAINVQRGNPKRIASLKDMTRKGVRVAIANPDGVCVGAYAVEIVESALTPEEKAAFRRNLTNYTGSCAKTAAAVSLKAVDAVIGWRVFQYWDPTRIETIALKPSQLIRIGYIPIAVSTYSKQKKLASRFIDFLLSDHGKQIFRKYRYFMTLQEAESWIGAKKPVGGTYSVPTKWLGR